MIPRNRGLLTVGKSVEAAVWWFATMDRGCHAPLLAEAVGQPTRIGHEAELVSRGQIGHELADWFQFRPLWQWVTWKKPDCLE